MKTCCGFPQEPSQGPQNVSVDSIWILGEYSTFESVAFADCFLQFSNAFVIAADIFGPDVLVDGRDVLGDSTFSCTASEDPF